MEIVRRIFTGKETPPSEPLPVHEMARRIRDLGLDMFYYGVIASDKPVPSGPTHDATRLPILLRYSDYTRRHFQALIDILRAPREFKLTERPYVDWEGSPDGDVVYAREEPNDTYYFPHERTAPFLNPLAAGIYGVLSGEPFRDVVLMREPGQKWILSYQYRIWSGATVYDDDLPQVMYAESKAAIGGVTGRIGLDKEDLLRFTFLPKPLDPKAYLARDRATRTSLKFLGYKQVGDFQTLNFRFDTRSWANWLKERSKFDNRPGVKHQYNDALIWCLEQDGDKEFSIVKLGTTNIEGLPIHIYSAAEQPPIAEREGQPNIASRPMLKSSLQFT